MPAAEKCQAWVAGNRHAQLLAAQADIGVLFAGSWEQYDRWIDDGPVPYTDPRWRTATTEAYAELLRELHGLSSHVALVLDSCHQVPEMDLPVEVLFEAGRLPAVVNDPARIAAVNAAHPILSPRCKNSGLSNSSGPCTVKLNVGPPSSRQSMATEVELVPK